MTLILCLDDNDGMLFNGRRQSADSVLCRHVEEFAGEGRLLMNAYSAKLFSSDKVTVSEAPIQDAVDGDCCFIENLDVTPYLKNAERLLIYRWNRIYPSDVKFPADGRLGWKLRNSVEFSGSSHDRITQEVYVR